MLVLTRRVNETIMVGTEVTLTILGVKGSQVHVASTPQGTLPFTGRSTSAPSANRMAPTVYLASYRRRPTSRPIARMVSPDTTICAGGGDVVAIRERVAEKEDLR